MKTDNIKNIMKILDKVEEHFTDVYLAVICEAEKSTDPVITKALISYQESFRETRVQLIDTLSEVYDSESYYITEADLKNNLKTQAQNLHNLSEYFKTITNDFLKTHYTNNKTKKLYSRVLFILNEIYPLIPVYIKRFERYTKNMTHTNEHLLSKNLCHEFLAIVTDSPLITRKHLTLIKS
jgi:hypothetical protein